MPRVELPDGQHAELKDPDDLRHADVRAAYKMADKEGVNLGSFGYNTLGALQDALLVRFIRNWSLTNGDGGPLPVNLESLGELPQATYNKLFKIVQPAMQAAFGGEEATPLSEEPSSTSDSTG